MLKMHVAHFIHFPLKCSSRKWTPFNKASTLDQEEESADSYNRDEAVIKSQHGWDTDWLWLLQEAS